MDGLYWKPYEQMDDLGVPLFLETPIYPYMFGKLPYPDPRFQSPPGLFGKMFSRGQHLKPSVATGSGRGSISNNIYIYFTLNMCLSIYSF